MGSGANEGPEFEEWSGGSQQRPSMEGTIRGQVWMHLLRAIGYFHQHENSKVGMGATLGDEILENWAEPP